MADRTFDLVQELSNLLREIDKFRRNLKGSRPLAKQFRETHARYEEAVRNYHEALRGPLPEEPPARQREEERRNCLATEFSKRTQENDSQWKRYTASLEFMNPFQARLELLSQRLPLTPEWQSFADEIWRLKPGIAQLATWREGVCNHDLDTLEFRVHEMINRAKAGSNEVSARITVPTAGGSSTPEALSRQPITPNSSITPNPEIGEPGEPRISKAKYEASRARERQAKVMPILESKRWTRGKWATEAGVGKNSVYEYLGGKRELTNANRKAMSEVLGLKPEDLPE